MKRVTVMALTLAMALCMFGCSSQSHTAMQTPQEDQNAKTSPSQKNATSDKSELRKELNSQGQYQEGEYPEDAWSKYKAALENAYAVNADDEASQEEVDSAKSSLSLAEYSLVNASSRDHPRKFDHKWYEWYKSNSKNREGSWVTAACMVSIAFQDDGKKYLVATIANDDATLSDHDVLLQATDEASLDDYTEGSVLAILGMTEDMKNVTFGKSYSEWLPVINVVEIQEAP